MLRAVLPLLAALLLFTPARADDCDALVARIVAVTGAKFERRAGRHIHLKTSNPDGTAKVHCAEPGFRQSVFVDAPDTALPSPAFFDRAAVLAEIVTGAPSVAVRASALRCQQMALRDSAGLARIEGRGFELGCGAQAPGRRDRGFFNVTVHAGLRRQGAANTTNPPPCRATGVRVITGVGA